jgi:hypothetical protein
LDFDWIIAGAVGYTTKEVKKILFKGDGGSNGITIGRAGQK